MEEIASFNHNLNVMELLRKIQDLMENQVLLKYPTNQELWNDYHSHMAYVYLLKED